MLTRIGSIGFVAKPKFNLKLLCRDLDLSTQHTMNNSPYFLKMTKSVKKLMQFRGLFVISVILRFTELDFKAKVGTFCLKTHHF